MYLTRNTVRKQEGSMQYSKNQPSRGEGEQKQDARQQRPSADTVFETLSNSRRREIIKCLWDREEAITTSRLVDEVAAAENDTDVQSLTYEQRKRVYTTLHQSHLPKLVEEGFVERAGDEVELTTAAERLKAHIQLENERERGSGDLSDIWNWIRSVSPV